ncbi:hypothetical protein [Polaribacter butkevichii]|uniref:Uncharacterized protein n=1 Tax=Polaribacter butkevichii TaxID=218490 RepID=A0A2P6CD11_9FLAO|nr:hypothetical protein [Polaribacter butkevichii]PQJ72783.1 hypothetical protein BTO14_05710 [Polaribacter butkevichii]
MKTLLEYIIHHSILKNKIIAYNFFRISLIVGTALILLINKIPDINWIFIIISLITWNLFEKGQNSFKNNFHHIKYINCTKRAFSWYTKNKKELFYNTIKQNITKIDFQIKNIEHKKFEELIDFKFIETVTHDFKYDIFISTIKELNSKTWIKDVFDYKKSFLQFLNILSFKIDFNSKNIENINSQTLANILYNNLQLTNKGVILDENNLKKEIDIFLKEINLLDEIHEDEKIEFTYIMNQSTILKIFSKYFEIHNISHTTNSLESLVYHFTSIDRSKKKNQGYSSKYIEYTSLIYIDSIPKKNTSDIIKIFLKMHELGLIKTGLNKTYKLIENMFSANIEKGFSKDNVKYYWKDKTKLRIKNNEFWHYFIGQLPKVV